MPRVWCNVITVNIGTAPELRANLIHAVASVTATRECEKGKGKIEDPKFYNCGQKHAASYSGCPEFPKINRPTFNSTHYNTKFSYSNAKRNQHPPAPNTRHPSPTGNK